MKYHIIKLNPLLNYAPYHEDAFGGGSMTPCILHFSNYMKVSSQLHAQATVIPKTLVPNG